ncbi:hypothetical protein [Actinomadura alba]|uniref:Thioredoxin domain-containing protein n=1 Tax=Actinomadura alba TaxID=406431 RepID=A0ABR7LGJ4_9ACTN|nr:hypothetical protein [Actinomadura alba]MBC6463957.1 hypothetical protein [Actinomadura alba]
MSLPTALALVSLLLSTFAVLAVGAVYSRLRLLERTALNPRSALLADEVLLAPEALRPTGDERNILVLLLNDGCAACKLVWHAVSEYAPARDLTDVRIVALFASADAAGSFDDVPGVASTVDPDLWAALSEGYTPCVFLIDDAGRVTDRRFVYGDTDVPALLADLVSAPEPAGSSRAL